MATTSEPGQVNRRGAIHCAPTNLLRIAPKGTLNLCIRNIVRFCSKGYTTFGRIYMTYK